ncbi:MAG: LPS assembly protein LptD [Desulfobulbaceae bacterium]|nr:LPS assembly protein LptD [Desulfobulbaceae bacterium]
MNHSTTPKPIVIYTAVFFSFLMILSGAAWGQSKAPIKQWAVKAEKITRYDDPPSIIAEGKVVLKKNEIVEEVEKDKHGDDWDQLLGLGQGPATSETEADVKLVKKTLTMTTIKADWLVYDVSLSTVKAKGNIFIEMGPDMLLADEATIDLKRETGTFHNATILAEHKDIHLEGKIIEKTGPKTYRIEDGWIVTCKLEDGQDPPWSFGSTETEVTDDGYAVLKNATFRIKDVPMAYAPYLVLPAKRTRQTGFLFPSISLSDRDGFGISTPFFVNLSPSADLTYYPYNMSNRGLMNGLEYRYVLREGDKGVFMANHLDDALTDPSEEDYYREGGYTHTNQDRYWLRGKVDQDLGKWITRLDLDVVSDSDYLTEFNADSIGYKPSNKAFLKMFGRGFQNKTTPLRDNTFRFLRSQDGMALQGEFLAVNDARTDDSGTSPLWKLPSLDFAGLVPMGESRADFSWNVDYVKFWRENGIGGNRINLAPKISTALPVSEYLETSASMELRNTSYMVEEYGDGVWDGSDSENRSLAEFVLETGTTMMRDFSLGDENGAMLNHTLRPFVSYDYLPYDDDEVYPIFDASDQVHDKSLIIYGVDNFFTLNDAQSASAYDGWEFTYFKIHQGYDLRDEQSEKPFTPVNFEVGYTPTNHFKLLFKTDFDTYDDGFTYYSLESNYLNSRGDSFIIDYLFRDRDARYNSLTDQLMRGAESIRAETRVGLFGGFALGYSIERDAEHDKTLEEDIALIYQANCWSMQLISHTTPGENKFLLLFQLANLGNPVDIDLPGIN